MNTSKFQKMIIDLFYEHKIFSDPIIYLEYSKVKLSQNLASSPRTCYITIYRP